MRKCVKCGAAENPLGRLRFRKHVDRKIYCENCLPAKMETGVSAPVAVSSALPATSAGSLVVIPCPCCRLMSNKPHGKLCEDCSGYGSVRIPVNFLNIYQPTDVAKDAKDA